LEWSGHPVVDRCHAKHTFANLLGVPDDRPLQAWELPILERTLVAGSVPADQARRLLVEVVRLRSGLADLERQLRELLA